MSDKRVCPQCGRPLPSYAPQGVCPACVARANLETGTGWGHDRESRPPPIPVEEVARLFPEMDVLGLLGSGGMGAVYKARQPKLDRLVALKILNRHDGDSRFVERFTREAQTLARLNHPNIVAVHEFGEREGHFFLIMELVDGVSLRHLLQQERMAPEQALGIVPPICEALEYAHEKGVIHRDIKPENILIDKEGRVKVADFGIARLAGAERGEAITGDADVMGTAHYMAPEQVERPAEVDHRADIYALGVVFYEMLTGELPLGRFPHPSQRVQIDVRLDEIVLRALEKEPELRYQQASEFRTGVATVTSRIPRGEAPGETVAPSAAPSARPWRFVAVATAVILGAPLAAWILYLALPSPSPAPDPEPPAPTAESEAESSRAERPSPQPLGELAQVPRMRAAVEYPMGTFPQGVTLADLNGDGHLDVITADREDHAITVRPGNGDGSFSAPVSYPTAPDPVFVRAADLTGNGILDVISANHSNSVTVFIGNGDGTLGEPVTYSTGEGELMTLSVAVADFTGDGIPDIAAANFMGDSVSLLPGLGNGVFGDSIQIAVGRGPISIAAADFNNNGRADLATANRRANSATVLLGRGTGGFTRTDYAIGQRAGFVVAGDLTNDGAVDLAIPNFTDGSISLLLGDGDGDFTRRDIDLGRCHPSSLALGDMNNDGRLDIVAVCQGMRSLAVYLNGGGARFSSPARVYNVGAAPDAVAVGDLNGDGLTDMVSANLRGNSISVLVTDNRPSLTGIVRDNAGDPLSDAPVFIHSAAPKEDPDLLGPFNYPDCAKSARTDANGRFTIARLDPGLRFHVAVTARGYQAQIIPDVDPANGPIEIILPTAFPGEAPNQRIRGRVVDGDGNPVPGAVARIQGVQDGDITSYGQRPGMDPLAVADHDGEFAIHAIEPFDKIVFLVKAGGFAPGVFPPVPSGDTMHEFSLSEGVTVTGRVLKDGDPLAGVKLGMLGVRRGMYDHTDAVSLATDHEGRFRFTNLQPEIDYHLYGIMQSLDEEGAILSRRLQTREVGSTLEVGDIRVQPGYRVEGRIRLTDGSTPPANTSVHLSRRTGSDSLETGIDSEGRFGFSGVPEESVSLSVRTPGYTLSLANASIDPLNPFRLMGRIQNDTTNLIIELEPGERRDRLEGEQSIIAALPLRGAEEVTSGDFRVSGTVVDSETGEPISEFTVMEGRVHGHGGNHIVWLESRKSVFSGGAFTIFLDDHPRSPALLIKAEGYLPHATDPVIEKDTVVDVALATGTGPQGFLFRPDGEPAAGAAVYRADMRNGVYMSGDGSELNIRDFQYPGTRMTRSDSEGRFRFPPRPGPHWVLILDETGYAELAMEELDDTSEVRLEPWGRVEGQLWIGAEPGTDETIRLHAASPPHFHHPRHSSPLDLYLETKTDSEGRFVFERVPPIPMEGFHQPGVRDTRFGPIVVSQSQRLKLEPGETRRLTLGGQGRPVIGRIVVEDYDGEIDWRADVQTLRKIVPRPEALTDFTEFQRELLETMHAAATDEEREAVRETFARRREANIRSDRAFYNTEAGMDYHLAGNRRYVLNFEQEGRFRIEDVPGGTYTLRIELREPGRDDQHRSVVPLIATMETEVEIPDSPGGRTDEPFDLGLIELDGPPAAVTP